MKTRRHLYYLIFAAIIMTTCCKQVYNPPATNTNNNYLVVSGFINSGNDPTTITLTRTSNLTATTPPVTEDNAQLLVEGDKGYSSQLFPLGSGQYSSNGLNLDNTQNYRLKIITSNGSTYTSDFTPVKPSPPIDSISWQMGDTAVYVYANTHDPQNNTRYYRWDYVETWEYHSHYQSYLHYNPGDSSIFTNATVVPHVCWHTSNSNNILIASSAKLSSDVIFRQPLNLIPINAEKISVKYSINVTQYAITADEFNYWDALQKSTEQTGTLFDQQPSQITGNIHCITNPNEPVIGYIGVGSVTSARIFIDNSQVAPWFYNDGCLQMLVNNDAADIAFAIAQGYLPEADKYVGIALVGYYFSDAPCVDCTLTGGSDVKPSFWP